MAVPREGPGLAARAVERAFGDAIPLQDLAGYAAVLLGNRAAAPALLAALRERWDDLERRLSEAPLMLRRMVEGMGGLTSRAELEAARELLAAHDLPAARQAVSQTLERLAQEVALWERIGPAVAEWLEAREARR